MLHAWKSAFLVTALFVLSGCPTPSKQPSRVAPIRARPAAPAVAESKHTNTWAGAEKLPSRTVSSEWILWDEWTRTRGRNAKTVTSATNATSESKAGSTVLAITSGSRFGSWNGVLLGLGFEPRLTNGQLFVHSLDAAKTLDPLISLPLLRPSKSRILVLDPGHGGENSGAKSILNDRFEKEFTLDWALRAQPLLSAKGWNVFLTRTADVDVSLRDRIAFADKVKADLFVSLHFNSAGNSPGRPPPGGLETYCLTPVGMPSHITRDYIDDPTLRFPNNAFDAQNLQFATKLHEAMLQYTARSDRGIRRARFMTVLREQNRPAVLLEGGYLSDPREARLVASAEYRQKLAESLAKALE